MTSVIQIKLAADRVGQLRAFAKSEGLTLNGAVGRLFEGLYGDTRVPCDIPSVSINALSDGLAIKFPDSKITGLSFSDAVSVVEIIRAYLRGDHRGEEVTHFGADDTGLFWIARKGSAFKVSIPAHAPAKLFSPDLLEDFAGLLECETKKKLNH